MRETRTPTAAIVDYGMGNLYSVRQACTAAGIQAFVTSARQDILSADAVILPGVGAFSDAMETLRRLDLVTVLQDAAESGKPLLGICLGMQLLMEESREFGRHRGLGLIEGEVIRLQADLNGGRRVKVPQVGWNRILQCGVWEGTLMEGLSNETYMYYVHSFFAVPSDDRLVLSTTQYGPNQFCSSLGRGSIFACQFHPERSGKAGQLIYRNLFRRLQPAVVHSEETPMIHVAGSSDHARG